MKKTPLQTVNDSFGSREKLVDQLASTADDPSSGASTKSTLMGLSNAKLLRLARIEETVRQRFGDKDKLIAHIVDVRKKAGHTADADYEAKLRTYSKGRLLDMTRMRLGEKSEKLTDEQRMARKRGRKQRERALAKKG
jgi:hypothetical protein